MTEDNTNDVKKSGGSNWVDQVGKAVKEVVKDRGFEIVKEPKTVIKAAPIIENTRITGGKIEIVIEF